MHTVSLSVARDGQERLLRHRVADLDPGNDPLTLVEGLAAQLDLFRADPAGPWIRRYGVLLFV